MVHYFNPTSVNISPAYSRTLTGEKTGAHMSGSLTPPIRTTSEKSLTRSSLRYLTRCPSAPARTAQPLRQHPHPHQRRGNTKTTACRRRTHRFRVRFRVNGLLGSSLILDLDSLLPQSRPLFQIIPPNRIMRQDLVALKAGLRGPKIALNAKQQLLTLDIIALHIDSR